MPSGTDNNSQNHENRCQPALGLINGHYFNRTIPLSPLILWLCYSTAQSHMLTVNYMAVAIYGMVSIPSLVADEEVNDGEDY
jgi:hypothetical protein